MSIDFTKLKACFEPDEVEWRVQRGGKKGADGGWAMVLAYITNRAIMDRLDDVCGPENWKNEYCSGPNGGILCGISVRIDGEWITKYDGADKTDIEAVKGGLSSAMKRAAVQWGIGRYLYNLDATFVEVVKSKSKTHTNHVRSKEIEGYWATPKLPGWALPEKSPAPPRHAPQQAKPVEKPAAAKAPHVDMFRDIPEERKAAARAKFWAISGKIWGDEGETKAREFCKDIFAPGPDGKPSMTASSVAQVSAAINAIDKHHKTQHALNGTKN